MAVMSVTVKCMNRLVGLSERLLRKWNPVPPILLEKIKSWIFNQSITWYHNGYIGLKLDTSLIQVTVKVCMRKNTIQVQHTGITII